MMFLFLLKWTQKRKPSKVHCGLWTSLGPGGGVTASAWKPNHLFSQPIPPVNQGISKHSQAIGKLHLSSLSQICRRVTRPQGVIEEVSWPDGDHLNWLLWIWRRRSSTLSSSLVPPTEPEPSRLKNDTQVVVWCFSSQPQELNWVQKAQP